MFEASGFRVWGLGFEALGLGLNGCEGSVQSVGFRVEGVGVSGSAGFSQESLEQQLRLVRVQDTHAEVGKGLSELASEASAVNEFLSYSRQLAHQLEHATTLYHMGANPVMLKIHNCRKRTQSSPALKLNPKR